MPLKDLIGLEAQNVKDEIYELEKKKQVNINKRKNLSASLYEVMYSVKAIYIRCLTICSSLLRTCKPSLSDHGIKNLLG